jgi:hypothetical protein
MDERSEQRNEAPPQDSSKSPAHPVALQRSTSLPKGSNPSRTVEHSVAPPYIRTASPTPPTLNGATRKFTSSPLRMEPVQRPAVFPSPSLSVAPPTTPPDRMQGRPSEPSATLEFNQALHRGVNPEPPTGVAFNLFTHFGSPFGAQFNKPQRDGPPEVGSKVTF